MKHLAQKLLEEKRNKAVEMIGKKIEVAISHKAISIDEENKTATFVMSTGNIDRHGDIVDQDSWILKYFEQNPAFFWQHESYSFPLGSWEKIWFEEDPENPGKRRMLGRARFDTDIDEVAERAFKHVVRGNLRMVSVGFIPHRVEYDEERDAFILYDCELLECSLVGIGSNRQALIKNEIEKTPLAEIKEQAIAVRDALDSEIEKDDNTRVINNLRALELLNKAIRQIN